MIRPMTNGTADLDSTTPNSRSEAQREASRRNGARSRGPRTAAGKARSSRNSMKHGLFAAKLAPPDGDPAEHAQAYWAYHRELAEEFSPSSFTERAAIGELARLYVQLSRATQMIESLQTTPLAPSDREGYEQLQRHRADLVLVDDARTRLEAEHPFDYADEEAQQLAELIGDSVQRAFDDLAELEAELAELKEEAWQRTAGDPLRSAEAEVDDDVEEDEEDQELRQWTARLEPLRHRLADRAWMTRLFGGERELDEGEGELVRQILEDRSQGARVLMDRHRDGERRVVETESATTIKLAQEPEQLMRLEDYRERLTRSIERQIARLER